MLKKRKKATLTNVIKLLLVNVFLFGAYSANAAVLYDQTGETSGFGTADTIYESSNDDSFDSAIADDFVVTDPEGWVINRLNITGFYGTTLKANSVNIAFYPDNAGSPDEANPVSGCSFTSLSITTDTAGFFAIGVISTDLPVGCTLPMGTYWFSHSANMDNDFLDGHRFNAQTTLFTVNGNEAHFRNPGDGFGTGCITFTPRSSCNLPSQDMVFSLEGIVDGAVIGNPTNISGSGCPDDTTIMSNIGYTSGSRMLNFTQHDVGKSDGMVADSGETWKSDCNFTLPIDIPAGKSIKKITLDWNGLSSGDTTKFRRKYLLNGQSYGPWKTKKFNFGPATEFALSDKLTFMDPEVGIDTFALETCGGTTLNLRVKTKLVAVYAHSYITIDSLMADSEVYNPGPDVTVVYGVCDPD